MSHERLSLHPFRRHANNQNAPAACCDKTEASLRKAKTLLNPKPFKP